MNPYKLTSQVSLAPDPQLSFMMEKFKQLGDAVSFSVVFNEVQRRKEVRDAAQSKMTGGPKPAVADQLIQETKMAQMPPIPQGMGAAPQGMPPQGMPPGGAMPPQGMPPQGMPPGGGMSPQMAMGPQGGPPPQGLPEQSGIGQLPAPNMQGMADGGIVSFAGDDNSFVLPNYYPDEGITSYAKQGGGVTAPETTTGAEEDEKDPYPRFDVRDAVGEYRSAMDKVLAEQQSNYDKYKAEREKFGSAYANAEARDKEMSQQYAEEAQKQSGIPWILAGAKLMQSSGKGLSGFGEAAEAGLPAYIAGREKLAALRDKQRDFMQTVAEARRAEQRGDMDKLYALQQSMTAQKANIAGVEAELGLKQDEIGATLSAAMLKGVGGKGTPGNEAYVYLARARMYRDAADDPKNAAKRDALLAEADKYDQLGTRILYAMQGVEPRKEAASRKELGANATKITTAIKLLGSTEEKDRKSGLQILQSISQGSGVPVEEILRQYGVDVGGGASNSDEVEFGSLSIGP